MSELTKKYIAVLGDVDNPKKDKKADIKKYTYNYADLTQVLGIVKSACTAHGLTVYQFTQIVDGCTYLCTAITDGDEERELAFSKMPEMADAQALGSWITYMRRYQLLIAFGLAPEDDDGKRATEHQSQSGANYKRAMWEAIKAYANANGLDATEEANSVMRRADWKDTPEKYMAVAQEYEMKLNG